MTALWRAEDLTLERPVAVRVLSATHARVQTTLDAARRAALVDDTRLQRVYGVGVEAGSGYVVLEWVTGQDAAVLAGKVSEQEALRIVVEAAEALRTAASRQLHHGRLGPAPGRPRLRRPGPAARRRHRRGRLRAGHARPPRPGPSCATSGTCAPCCTRCSPASGRSG